MKIGTKANAINDLGKFDGSNMTIKVNGKQIYPQKRYAIVRVDNKCPIYLREFTDKEAQDMFCCSGKYMCKNCRYGDTKEQLVRKVAQGIIIASKKRQIYIANPKAFSKAVSKIIVEFLGVE